MIFFAETKRRIINLTKAFLLTTTVFYFSYHMISGEKGIIAMLQLRQQVNSARMEMEKVHSERDLIERKVDMMSTKSLDKDLLDEQTRKLVGGMGKNEFLYIEDQPIKKEKQ